MAGAGARLSFVWLLMLELAAVIAMSVLYIARVLGGWAFVGAAAGSAGLAAALFLAARQLLPRLAGRGGGGRPRRAARADNGAGQIDEYLSLGRQLLHEQRFDEAARMFDEVLARNSRNWQACNYLGRAYSGLGLFDEAKEAYERAIGLEFNFASAHFNLAAAHEKLGEPEKALERWRQFVEIARTIGERPDMIDHANKRIATLERRVGRRDDDVEPWDDEFDGSFDEEKP